MGLLVENGTGVVNVLKIHNELTDSLKQSLYTVVRAGPSAKPMKHRQSVWVVVETKFNSSSNSG